LSGDDAAAGGSTARASLRRIADWFAHDAPPSGPGQWLGRFVVLRLLGVIYLMAFLTLVNQGRGLIGAHGLEPAARFLDDLAAQLGGRAAGFRELPTLFWLAAGDGAIIAAGWVGVALSLLMIGGFANALTLVALCALQISVVAIGQDFYAFGWETQLVETGFLCIFLCPLLDARPFPRRPPPAAAVWALRWLIMRVMWGAGLIKLRGDACWRDLTCLDFHFETQPIPSPLTRAFHFLPGGAHAAGVLFNHVVELAAPFLMLAPWRRVRYVAGALMAALQLVPILACFDDVLWRRVLPRALVARAERARAAAIPSRAQGALVAAFAVAVVALSIAPVVNLLSPGQAMNTSFTRLPLINTYGAFGSVGHERYQLVFEGTTDETITPATGWREYQWKCQPVDPARRPCWMSPYHRRLDWLLWFAAMGRPRDYPWAVHLVWKLLEGDRAVLGLVGADPFGGTPPRHIQVVEYRYRFAPRSAGVWWTRERLGTWLPPVSRDNEELQLFLRQQGWFQDR
jgi:hypothetical protein